LAALNNMDFEEAEIKKMGSYDKGRDAYKLKEKGKKIQQDDGEFVGIQFKLKSSKDTPERTECSITTPNGETIKSELIAQPNELTTLVIPVSEKGEYAFKVKFADHAYLETLKQKIKVK